MNIAFVRHGPTAWSVEKRLQGRRDIALSEFGRAQVESWTLPLPFRNWPRLSSPLTRCQQTAMLLKPQLPVQVEPQLIECDFGEFEGRTLADIRAELGRTMVDNEARGLDFQPPGGESPRQLQARLTPWLNELFQSDDADRNIVAVTHKGVIRAAVSLATQWDMIGRAPVKLKWQHLHHFKLSKTSGSDESPHTLSLVQANIAL